MIMQRTAYRVHSADESLDTLRNNTRPDGWVASDETAETQPHGISACSSLEDLRSYVRYYSMALQPGDRVVAMRCKMSYDEDRDRYAIRVVDVEDIEVLGDAREVLS